VSTVPDDNGSATDAEPGRIRRLVIVESPAKAKTIKGYLGPGYVVEASVGHIRDLPKGAADIPAAQKGQPWARLGVNVEEGFEPLYVVDADKRSKVAELKRELKNADELLLATDEDREGEAIAWHLLEVLQPKVPVRRMVFHEITRDAIREAARNTRDLDLRLVDAQETRRIIDRLYGYEVSPVLWKKVMQGLSAGRVQSVATRLVVERERERIAFVSAGYWDLDAVFDPGAFSARLVGLDGARVATGRDFASDGTLVAATRARAGRAAAVALDEATVRSLADALAGAAFAVRTVDEKPYRRSPAAPFMTSTLQQEASRKLRYSSQTAMRIAQRLYENGYITYMRTDSTTLSASAITAARTAARDIFGADTVADSPRQYTRKVKNAQEAHEAIRPSGDSFRTPGEVAPELSADELALYDLIWKRTVASQMADARGFTVTVRLGATASDGRDAEFSAAGTVITARGFLAAYEEGRDDDSAGAGTGADDEERRLPPLKAGDALAVRALEPEGHATLPPSRYTEATLIKALEERGIGRPSTYASIMGTILDRGYVWKKGSALVPSFLAFSVVSLLEKHFGELVDYDFTARMEEILDLVAGGDAERLATLRRFYYGGEGASSGAPGQSGPADGSDFRGLHPMVSDLGEIDARSINSIPIGNDIVLRVGRYGPYLERERPGDDGEPVTERASVPDDTPPDELTVERAEELLGQPSGDRSLGSDPESGREIVAKVGRYGPYVTEVLPEDAPKTAKARTASLFKDMSLDSVRLEDALLLLSLPRAIGVDPVDGVEISAQNGRYGPYIKKGTDSRSLDSEAALLTVTLDEALALLAQPKPRGRGRGAAAPPLRELGVDTATGKPVVVKDGRFGAYVTDGETNATLRKADAVESVTLERAAELLAEKRAKGPAPKKRAPARRR
jgi:DNA topoisomerase I